MLRFCGGRGRAEGASSTAQPPAASAGSAAPKVYLHTLERGIGVDLHILNELYGSDTVRIENASELLDGSGFSVHPISLGIPPDEKVDEARWMRKVLPDFVPYGAGFVRANVRNEFVYRVQALL